MKNLIAVVLVGISTVGIGPTHAQPQRYLAEPVLNRLQGDVLGELSGEGYAPGTRMPIFNLGSGNPAALGDFVRYSGSIGKRLLKDTEPPRKNNVLKIGLGVQLNRSGSNQP